VEVKSKYDYARECAKKVNSPNYLCLEDHPQNNLEIKLERTEKRKREPQGSVIYHEKVKKDKSSVAK